MDSEEINEHFYAEHIHASKRETSAREHTRPRKMVDCEITHRLKRKTKHFYNGAENFPYQTRFKNFERKHKKESPEGTIFARSGLVLLHGLYHDCPYVFIVASIALVG